MTARRDIDWHGMVLPLLIGLGGLLVLFGLAFLTGPKASLAAYAWAWLFWLGPSAGSLVLLMIHRLTGGRWGEQLAPALVPAAMALPVIALLFLPLLLGVGLLYPWAGEPQAAASLDVARLYLNVPGFALRAVVILALWSGLSVLFAWRADAPPLAAALGLLVYAITVSFAAVDWAMSSDPRFVSTAFGAGAAIAQILSALAFAGLWGARSGKAPAPADHAGLMLASLLGLVYLQFMQYLVIWAGGLPDKSAWYLLRASGGWSSVMLAAAVIGVLLPFLLLLPSRLRADGRSVAWASPLILAGLLLFWRWQMADLEPGRIASLADLAAPVGLGALWIAWMRYRRAEWAEGLPHE